MAHAFAGGGRPWHTDVLPAPGRALPAAQARAPAVVSPSKFLMPEGEGQCLPFDSVYTVTSPL